MINYTPQPQPPFSPDELYQQLKLTHPDTQIRLTHYQVFTSPGMEAVTAVIFDQVNKYPEHTHHGTQTERRLAVLQGKSRLFEQILDYTEGYA